MKLSLEWHKLAKPGDKLSFTSYVSTRKVLIPVGIQNIAMLCRDYYSYFISEVSSKQNS